MACHKMKEYVAYARNTESGCKHKPVVDVEQSLMKGSNKWKEHKKQGTHHQDRIEDVIRIYHCSHELYFEYFPAQDVCVDIRTKA